MSKLRLLIAILFLSMTISAETISTMKVPDGKISISRFLDYNNIRKNPDGKKFYKTRITITVEYKNQRETKELLSGLYTPKDILWNGMSPAILFDPKKMILTVFMTGKTSRYDYGMEGYAFRYTIKSKKWQKEKIFDNANFGWFSFFEGSNDGQPVLWYFSFAGYYAIKSERAPNGVWSNYIEGKISPNQAQEVYKKSKKILITSDIGNQSMIYSNTSNDNNTAIKIGVVAIAAYGLFKLFEKALRVSSYSNTQYQHTDSSKSISIGSCHDYFHDGQPTCGVSVDGESKGSLNYKYNSHYNSYDIMYNTDVGGYYLNTNTLNTPDCGSISASGLSDAIYKAARCFINGHY